MTASTTPASTTRSAWYDVIDSPLGAIFVGGSAERLHRVDFMTDARDLHWFVERLERDAGATPERDPAGANEAVRQLHEYFAGRRTDFDLPFAARGTPFQQQVWRALQDIPHGRTVTYGEIAARLGHPSASRAVGAANGRNPLAIVVPCHRVIGGGGALTGYASGLDRKRWLLAHEGALHETATLPLVAAAGD